MDDYILLIYRLLDYFFIIFHTALIFFNVFGWIWVKTRLWNFITLNLTAFSWFVLGIWYGWGYCFCTDWHWGIRAKLELPIYSNSYISFLIYILTGSKFSQQLVDTTTLIVFVCSYGISTYFQFKKLLKKIKNCLEFIKVKS